MSRDGFFNSGVTRACFQAVGNTPKDKDWLMMAIATGASVVAWIFSNHVGQGSRVEDLVGNLSMTRMTSSLVIVEKLCKELEHRRLSQIE